MILKSRVSNISMFNRNAPSMVRMRDDTAFDNVVFLPFLANSATLQLKMADFEGDIEL